MAMRRRPAADYQALKHSRAAYTGSITKAREKVVALKEEDASTYKPKQLERLKTSVSHTQDGFTGTVEEAYDFNSKEANYEELQAEEEEIIDTFTEAVAEVKEIIDELLYLHAFKVKLVDLDSDIRALRDSFTTNPELEQDHLMKALEKKYEELRKGWISSGVDLAHPLKQELEAYRVNLTQLNTELAGPKDRSPSAADTSVSSTYSGLLRETKVPEQSLPKFRGDIMGWAEFWNDFENQIGKHEWLSDEDKLSYLRRAVLDPDAQSLLHCPSQTPGMYQEMVKKLKRRYDKKSEIHQNLVQQLLSIAPAKNTRTDIRRLEGAITNTMESLKHTGFFSLETFLTSMVYLLLPVVAQTRWEQLTGSERGVCKIEKMMDFLDKHEESLPAQAPHSTPNKTDHYDKKPNLRKNDRKPRNIPIAAASPTAPVTTTPSPTPATVHPAYKWPCIICTTEKHPLFLCPKWQEKTVPQRWGLVQSKNLCKNCLAVGHATDACRSRYKCRECGENHHTSVHQSSPSSAATPIHTVQAQDVGDLLMTCRLMVVHPDGRRKPARALLDIGAAMNLMSTHMAESLQLPLDKANLTFTRAMGGPLAHSHSIAQFAAHSTKPGQPGLLMQAAVVDQVTADLPVQRISPATEFPHLQGLDLADPTYHIPDRVDLILGFSAFFKVVKHQEIIEGPLGTPTAIKTIFGWGVGGSMNEQTDCQLTIPLYHSTPTPVDLAERDALPDNFTRFWEVEETEGAVQPITPPDELVQQHYLDNVVYSPERRRYTVALPKREDVPLLGDSRPQALARYVTHERSILKRNSYQPYQAVMQEYFDLGHAEPIPAEASLPSQHFYMPMHAVVKETSTTTKLRIVFDGSAQTSTGISLNSTLHCGPTLQPTLAQTLMKFRTYPIGLSADISKMYREVELREGDRDMHRFLWRASPQDPVQDFRMVRVTFGISSSPYLAIRTLQQTSDDHGKDHPTVQMHVSQSFYVDDFLGGASTVEEAVALTGEMREVLSRGSFDLRKWRSSSSQVVMAIPPELREGKLVQGLTDKESKVHSKALGVDWRTQVDTMFPELTLPEHYSTTKRGLVSDVSRIFDILGWIAPCILLMKMAYQELWAHKTDWDEQIPTAIKKRHQRWREELPHLAHKQLPRYYHRKEAEYNTVELHGFADTSKKAYGAVVYVRTTYDHHPPLVTLVIAKTKVAPLPKASKGKGIVKELTIPRLELCGAHLLTKLLTNVGDALHIPWEDRHAWSDSSCILSWLDGNPRDYQVFVTNRVSQILEVTSPQTWKHVPTLENPADAASRGLYPKDLSTNTLWWNGPEWLHSDPIIVPKQPPRKPFCVPELRCVSINVISADAALNLEERCATFFKLVSYTAWWLRYMSILTPGSQKPDSPNLTPTERRKAERVLVRRSQQRSFPKEIKHLLKYSSNTSSSRIKSLFPFMDSNHLIRVGGRLANSSLTQSQTHPLIVDSKDHFTILLFKELHVCLGHCGPSLLLCFVGIRYHVLGAKRLAQAVCNQCKTCIKASKLPIKQLMGQLPTDRVTPSPPFHITGMDFAGPFKIKQGYVRKPHLINSYVCVFLCFTTRAIHIEVVSDLTTEAFLASLKRFVSRRGVPHILQSDNGGNFQGAQQDLKALYRMLKASKQSPSINAFLLQQEITWNMSPSRAPHFGGLWEAGVKSLKFHLKRVVGNECLTFEEFSTVTCQVEAILNSRPLLPITSHSADGVSVLTPGHFLTLTAYPETHINDDPRLLKTWNKCQAMAQHFWHRWSTEYLQALQARRKWTTVQPNLQVGDIVIISKDKKWQTEWPIARVLQTYPGRDGLVRVVLLKTATTEFKRSVVKLTLLHRDELIKDTLQAEPSPGSMLQPDVQQGPPASSTEQGLIHPHQGAHPT